ncbi:DUF1631 family protein [Cellvibrio sp. pealriver]|uniref:DUF1631 family protein n=1 Tax=Cellvibrio sp. pealriver TaxID=1622269 RepID=UPI00066FB380|nr:DUF1631 family protein [Cellvibrio sp. pealriver]
MSEFTLHSILNGDSLQLSEAFASIAAAESIAPETIRQQLADALVLALSRHRWDTRLQHWGAEFHSALQAHIAQDDDFYCSNQHPLREFLAVIYPPASHWSLRDSKPNQQLQEKLCALLDLATRYAHSHGEEQLALAADLHNQLDDFRNWLSTEDKRAAMLESRLCESELANLKLTRAETKVVELFNRTLAGRPLPGELHTSLTGNLKGELQYWAFNTDPAELPQLPLWKSWQRILPALGQIFAEEGEDTDDQYIYNQIPLLLAELERSLQYPTSNPAAYTQLVEQTSQLLMAAIQKQPLECARLNALTSDAAQGEPNTRIPNSLLQQTEKIREGDWIGFDGEDENPIRCKLALKNPEVDLLLFVDHTGRKVMTKNNKDFALCLSTGIARPLENVDLNTAIIELLTPLLERANRSVQAQLLAQKRKAEQVVAAIIAQQQAAAKAAEEARLAEQEKLQAQLEARRNAARKALAEAKALADEKNRREAEQAAEAERLRIEQAAVDAAEQLERQQQATLAVNELQVGAWLEISAHDKPAETLRAKLSVIISSTGKYIFADQVGRKLAEYSRPDLIELIATGTLRVLRNGDNFEDQLAKVIRGLRRDIP